MAIHRKKGMKIYGKKRKKLGRRRKDNYKKYTAKLKPDNIDWSKVEKIYIKEREAFLKNQREERILSPYSREILTLLASGAVLGMSLMIPALPVALASLVIKKERFNSRYFSQTIGRLKKQKLVEIVEENGQTLVRITQEGKVRALRYKLGEITVKKPKVWDRKWRIVIFDIPEKYKRVREIFRNHLKALGFYMVQKSVWLHPYPCFDEIEFIRQIYDVGINVTYLVAEQIEGVKDLKQHFSLK